MKTYVVQLSDVGKTRVSVKSRCSECGAVVVENPVEPLGRVMTCDVGKMCRKSRNGVWYVENDSQFNARRGRLCAEEE